MSTLVTLIESSGPFPSLSFSIVCFHLILRFFWGGERGGGVGHIVPLK